MLSANLKKIAKVILANQGKVILIGVGGGYAFHIPMISSRLRKEGYSEIADLIDDEKYEVFDMLAEPHKGDALDHIHSGVPAVVAHHLFYTEPNPKADYFYNRNNKDILSITHRYRIPLFVFGDQPTGEKVQFKAYNI